MSNEKDIRNQFIVDEEQYTKDKVQKYAEKALKYAKIAKNGQILIENHALPTDDKIKLCLVVRYIAHSFDDQIPVSASLSEIQKIVQESTEAVGSRLSQIVKSGFAKKLERGIYQVMPHKIEGFLDQLDNRQDQSTKTRRPSAAQRKQPAKGIGKDIAELVSNGFFNTPKTIKEISKKLKEEVKFHDDRVIDATVRNVYVSSKKILKRIPATDKGKARWEYVLRK